MIINKINESVFKNKEYLINLNVMTLDVVKQINELRLTKTDEEIFLMIRNGFDNLTRQSGLFKEATCKKGCSFCCHDKIILSKMEIERIKKVIKEKNIVPNQQRLKVQKQNKTNIKWMDKACSLLSEPNEKGERVCMIYEDRPMICRSHNSMEDPKSCNKSQFPNKEIKEGRIIELDALSSALILANIPQNQECFGEALHNVL